MTPLRLLHITTTDISLALLLGGQLRAFADAGYDVMAASAPGPWVGQLQSDGITHLPLKHASRARGLVRDGRALAEVLALLARTRPHIVHTHNPKPGIYGRLAARAAGVPIVVNTVHGLYALPSDPVVKRTAVYALERLAATCSHAELVQNTEDLEVLARLGVPRRKLHLLGNGVDLDHFDPLRVPPGRREAVRAKLGVGPDEVLCGVVGRLVWEKGYRQIFAAASSLRAAGRPARFAVVGPFDPDKRDALTEGDVARARDEAGVRFLGMRQDMVDLYGAMDVFVLASRREGFSRSGMESAAMGLPVVATDVRGCRQVVDDGVTGFLVPPGDARSLATRLVSLVDDPDRRAAMGRAARAKAVAGFDQRTVIAITLGVYEQLSPRLKVGHGVRERG